VPKHYHLKADPGLYKLTGQAARFDIAKILQTRLTQPGLRRHVSAKAKEAARLTGSYIDAEGRFSGVSYKRNSFSERAAKQESRNIGIWVYVNREIHSLICTKSAKYASVRRILASKEYKASQKAIAYLIAGAVAVYVGLTAVVVFPFVALALAGFLALGKNTYCARFKPRRERRKKR
jgi:hypothetical protein